MAFVQHILTADTFADREDVEVLFESAACLKAQAPVVAKDLEGRVLATLFYEPSTRTRFSFEVAAQRLGGAVVSAESAGQFSSSQKGESLEDTLRILSGYVDGVVVRHPESRAITQAAVSATVPVINAGDGSNEHPTQALLDLFTMSQELGRIDGLRIALVGDLKYGRTVHSIARLLRLFKPEEVILVSPSELAMPETYVQGLPVTFSSEFDSLLGRIDVLYMTRVQKERFASAGEYEKFSKPYSVTREVLDRMQERSIIMHPLPRLQEIDPIVDNDPRAAYFREAENGLYVRMALLKSLLA